MRRMVWSRAGTGGRQRLLSDIISAAERGGEVIWLVPEPYSHASERILAEAGGASVCLNAEVTTFARLCDRILTALGGRALPSLDAGGRLLTLRRAARQTASGLSELLGVLSRPELLEALSTTLDICKCYGITPALLEKASHETEGTACNRLRELSLIFGAYDALCAQSAMDSRDRTLAAAEKLKEGRFGAGCCLFISHFASFTPQERLLLKALASKAAEVTLFFEGLPNPLQFPAICRTAAVCRREWGEFETEIVETAEPDRASSLRCLEQTWFDPLPKPLPDDGAIEIYRAASPAEECRFAAERICLLTQDEGLRYRDIAVLCADEETYGSLAAAIFPHYRIPLFQDRMDSIADKPLCRLIQAAADCVKYGFRPQDVMRLVRTRLTGVPEHAADRLEHYLRRWNIYGGRFMGKQDWTRSPSGYNRWGEYDTQALEELNQTRRFLTAALRHITVGRTARDCAGRLLSMLSALQVPETIEAHRWELIRRGEPRAAAECAQMWDFYCDAAEQCALLLGDEPMETDEYLRLLLLVLSGYSVGAIPASLDRVHCGDIGRFARIPVKAVIILGASFDNLPARGTPESLLTLSELSALDAVGCELPPDPYDRMERELYNLYTACALPKQKLMILYSLSAQGEDLPAEFVKRMEQEVFVVPPARYPVLEETFPLSRAPLSGENPQKLYGRTLLLSASRLEKWSGCRFAYFCRYGLRAEAVAKPGFQPMDIGSFIHDILRKTLERVMKRGGFDKVTADWVRECAAALSSERVDRMLRPPEGERVRLWKQGERLVRSIEKLAGDLHEEFSLSDFVPVGFEERLSELFVPFRQPIGGVEGYSVSGSADRIDRYDKDGKTYLRVIDYKMKKDLSFSDMLAGKSLQMPLYLFQLCTAPPDRLGIAKAFPAGVMYIPTNEPVLRTDAPLTEEEARHALRREMRRSGLYLSNPDILAAMDHAKDKGESFTGLGEARGRGSGSSVADAEQMAILERFVAAKRDEMALSLANGDIRANPLLEGADGSECQYCEYRPACHFDETCDTGRHKRKSATADMFFSTLSALEQGEGEDEQ